MQKRRMLMVCSVCLVLLFSLAGGALAANANFGKTAAVYRAAANEALQMNGYTPLAEFAKTNQTATVAVGDAIDITLQLSADDLVESAQYVYDLSEDETGADAESFGACMGTAVLLDDTLRADDIAAFQEQINTGLTEQQDQTFALGKTDFVLTMAKHSMTLTATARATAVPRPPVVVNGIRLVINGETIALDVPPQEVEGRVLVPVRGVFETLGAVVDYNTETQIITITKEDTIIKLQVGEKQAKVNGVNENLDVPAREIDGRTLVPIRFVSEALAANVTWLAESQTVQITEKTTAPPEEETGSETPEQPTEPVKTSGTYVGSLESDKFHRISCRYAREIAEENEIWFDDADEAREKGYTPCEICEPN